MTCDDAIRAIDAMIDGEIEEGERFQLDAHLAECEACRIEVGERRAFSARLGRDLPEAFPGPAPGSRRVVVRPSRFPWIRVAAVVVAGVAIGFMGARSGLFTPASAEAREVANLSALREAYERRDVELSTQLTARSNELDERVYRAPDGAVRDAGAIGVMNGAAGLAAAESLPLPTDTVDRTRAVLVNLSSADWPRRGVAVRSLRQLVPADASHVEAQSVNLNGANRLFVELCVRSLQTPSVPAVESTFESTQGTVRVVQLQDARLRVEVGSTPRTQVYEASNLFEFRRRYPQVTTALGLYGVEGNFTVGGVHLKSPEVVDRPAAFVPVLVWRTPDANSGAVMETLSGYAVLTDHVRAGRSAEESERAANEAFQQIRRIAPAVPITVQADPERVRVLLSACRRYDAARLAAERERLNDELATLERRVTEKHRRLACVLKAAATLDYAPK